MHIAGRVTLRLSEARVIQGSLRWQAGAAPFCSAIAIIGPSSPEQTRATGAAVKENPTSFLAEGVRVGIGGWGDRFSPEAP
jgi:hypothetical protein